MANEKDIGAMWNKSGKNGVYLSGSITLPTGEKLNFVAFKNGYKKKDNQPDWKIYPQQPREQHQPKETAANEWPDDGTPF